MSSIRLKSLKYYDWKGRPKAWDIDNVSLRSINLIVGKNATGKTRLLNVISGLARLLMTPSAQFMVDNGHYDVVFDSDGKNLQYSLDVEDGLIKTEIFDIDGVNYLSRNADSTSQILMFMTIGDTNPQKVEFRPPPNELAVVVRRDDIQHPYLEQLHIWAKSTRRYNFGSNLGKTDFAIFADNFSDIDDSDPSRVVGIFAKAEKQFGKKFVKSVITDMKKLHYQIDEIVITSPISIKIIDPLPPGVNVSCIGIKEDGLPRIIDQTEISQGMFRALSILIQVNYSLLAKLANCILIDDIGEGLDYERSTELIKILREKAEKSNIQLVMTTNDRFVMNNVPLDEWIVLQRTGSTVRVRDYQNSKEVFDDFKFTGLSNFSFFELDFLNNNEPIEIDQ